MPRCRETRCYEAKHVMPYRPYRCFILINRCFILINHQALRLHNNNKHTLKKGDSEEVGKLATRHLNRDAQGNILGLITYCTPYGLARFGNCIAYTSSKFLGVTV